MGRLLLIVLMGLVALGPWHSASAAEPVRSTGSEPYQRNPELQEYLDSLDAMEEAAEQANEEARLADEALRREKAAEIRAHDAKVDAWRKAHPAPEGTLDTLVHDTYDEAYNAQSTELIYINRWQIPTHKIDLDPQTGEALGPVQQTQQGKAWETIGPKVSPGQPPGLLYGEDDNGERTITSAEIPSADGKRIIAKYEFNEDGVAWRGETFDAQTGQRTGGFQDERLKPKPRTLGGPLDVPSMVRLITGVCEKCRPLVNRHNDLASEINTIVLEMQSLSAQHQKAYPPAQGPIMVRYNVLKARLDALMPQFEAARRAALDCDKACREPPKQDPPKPQTAGPQAEPFESILDSIEDPTAMPPRPESILDEIEEPARPTPSARDPDVQPTKDAYPPTDEDLKKVMAAAQAYLAAANCDGMKCPKITCPEAQRALQALLDMEFYVKQTVFYAEQANADHMAHLTALAQSNLLNGQQRDLLIRVIAIQEFYQNFGSMMLDIASVGSWAKGLATNPKSLDELSPAEALDRLNDLYQASKDMESLVATLPSGGGKPASTGIADAVDVAGGVDKDFVNNTTSTITDLKSIAVDARGIIEEAQKNGKDWRSEFKKSGILSAVGQITGRYLKAWSQANLEERQQRMNDLLRDAKAGDIVQAQAYIELQRAQRRRWAAVDALAAVQEARAAYQGCLYKVCGLMSVSPPIIPEFEHVVAGTQTTKYDWGAALRWLNGAIAQTLPKLRPVAFTDDCPEEEQPRADPRLPPEAARPPMTTLSDPIVPASFCTQVDKVNYLTSVYNPAAATALANSQTAQAHLGTLNGLFTQYMRNEGGPVWAAIQKEMALYAPIAAEAYAQSSRVNALYDAIMAVPVTDCPQLAENTLVPSTGEPLIPVNDPEPGKPRKPDCPPEDRRKPIVVGPNNKVGSGARLKAKAASTAMGIAGGLLGGALPGGGGGGGGGGGPQLATCKIKDSEMTVFTDPVSGVSLKVGAKRAGGTVVVFADIAKSPDNGTFQTAFVENGAGETMAPSDVDICDLWGEWKLTVSWTKSTYVDGQLVKRESGGWSKTGLFKIPGVLSTTAAPDGLWKRLGFSNASHGARKIAMQYPLPAGGGPVDTIIHVTRPGGDPVTTVPFALRMVEGPGGFTFTKAPDQPCPPPESILDDIGDTTPPPESLLDDIGGTSPLTPSTPGGQPAIPAAPPPSGGTTTTRPRDDGQPITDVVALDKEFDDNRFNDDAMKAALERNKLTYKEGCPNLVGEFQFRERKDRWIARLRERLAKLKAIVPSGKFADSIREAVEAETARTQAVLKEAQAMEAYCPVPGFEGWPGTTLDPDAKPAAPEPKPAGPGATPPAPGKAPDPGDKAPESILDDIDESPPVIG